MVKVIVRPSEKSKVPHYKKRLKKALVKSKKISLDLALKEWTEEITTRRLKWFVEHQEQLNLSGTEVKKGFQLILYEYMGIPPEEIEVVEESKKKIVYRCYNFCPYYEAMKKLGLSPQEICPLVTESPVQIMLNQLNTKLHYSRNYKNGIRSNCDYCEECIELIE